MTVMRKKEHVTLSRIGEGLFMLEVYSKSGYVKKTVGSYSFVYELFCKIRI